jgi:fumarate reductase subunit C
MKLDNGHYIRPLARYTWWTQQSSYIRYILREVSSLFIGFFSIVLVCGLYRLSQGEAEFNSWREALWSNGFALSIIVLFFAGYHSVSWFSVTPKAMPLTFSGKRVAPEIIIGAHWLLWLLSSAFVWLLFIYGGDL